MKVSPFWLLFCSVCGVVSSGVYHERTQQILLLLAEIIYNRWWLVFLVLLVIVAGHFTVQYFIKLERIRIETELTDKARRQIWAKLEKDQATKNRHIDRLQQTLQSQRQRLQKSAGNVYQEADRGQQDRLSFVHYVEQVQDLLARRSERLQKQLPDNPVKLEKVRQRDHKLQAELYEVLQGLGETFPEVARTIPPPRPMKEPESMEVLELKERKETGRVAEYKRKKIKSSSAPTSSRRQR